MEAAHIPWRPLGLLLVEQGLLTDEELEQALAKQQVSGKRLGETIVECGFVSSPDLSNALAAQYGIKLTTEKGFGTGLRAQIQRRHENDRGRPALTSVPEQDESSPHQVLPEFAEPEPPPPAEAMLLTQLEEQWARLAAAEESLVEQERELRIVLAERDYRQAQAQRLARRAWHARESLREQRGGGDERRRAQVARFVARVRARDAVLDEQRLKLGAGEERLVEQERELAALRADRDRRRAQAARFVQRIRAREDDRTHVAGELEEQRLKLGALEERLAEQERELAALRADRDRRRAQAARFVQRIRARDEDRAQVVAELDDHRRQLNGAEQHLAEREHTLAALTFERDRRRAQAGRFVQRIRGLQAELEGRDRIAGQLEAQRAKLAAAEQQLAERGRELATVATERDERRAQVVRFVQRVRTRDAELEHRDGELRGHARVAAKLEEQRAKLVAAEQRLAERDRELTALAADRDRRRTQAVGFVRRMRVRDEELAHRLDKVRVLDEANRRLRDQVERLTNDVHGCDAEIARLRSESTRRRAQAARFANRIRGLERERPAPSAAPAASHLVFLQLADGYELVERDGPPPPRHSPLEFPDLFDGALVVAGSRPSPFPGDTRPCVVAQAS